MHPDPATLPVEFFALFSVTDDAGLKAALLTRFNASEQVSVQSTTDVVEINDVTLEPQRRSLAFTLPQPREFIVEKLAAALGASIEVVEARIADPQLTGPF